MGENETVDYHPMWAELGLDLEKHDCLLEAVGELYGSAYLGQRNRPAGMAHALGFTLEELASAALTARDGVAVSSMCTVFAESEVTGLVHRGEDRGRIARGLHEAIAKRTLASLGRVGARGPLVFAGGVANNLAMVDLVRVGFEGEVIVPESAQTVGALGAALCVAEDRR
ncbi:MAG: hypothetical protein FDZ70_04200 [Actinobacteria bacterium]|nr:MAG: hypothetical protein FDZ70_04200 [Actinomycetota bacterium]